MVPKGGPKHVATIKYNQCEQFDWFIFRLPNTTNQDTQQNINSEDNPDFFIISCISSL
jgi:hypothetical protein